jgi:hypothetical protein
MDLDGTGLIVRTHNPLQHAVSTALDGNRLAFKQAVGTPIWFSFAG